MQVDTFPLWVDNPWATEIFNFSCSEENAENTD